MGMMLTAGIAAAATGAPVPSAAGPEATASGGPATAITLGGRHNLMARRSVTLSGRVTPGGGRAVSVLVGGHRLRTHTKADGTYKVSWRPARSGVYRARATVDGSQVRSHRVGLNVYRPAAASYYGPGLYGGGLACGGTLTPGKLGVANKTLPCGARVTLRYRGHTVTVPVIDRGPYSGNREYDLTAATKAKLGFPSTGTVLTTR
jgi:rare lipoprotein A